MMLDSSPKVTTFPSLPSMNTSSQLLPFTNTSYPLPPSTSLSTAKATRSTKLLKTCLKYNLNQCILCLDAFCVVGVNTRKYKTESI
ncbi:Uncharacterized protein APZ42_009175 [Daphnia magna]|uniref:Uncharacterized protein n=1 Tax=Daphnia magna TaxID=35525 RepID=A0A164E628_9CRUS|nr:Uncharacterized protein APZ42_009175 [Daphnia magna]